MNLVLRFFSVSLLMMALGCGVPKYAARGKVLPKDFYHKTTFTTAKGIVLLPAVVNGQLSNYLFDTGAELTAIHRDTIRGKIFVIRGASNRTVENGSETIASFRVGNVNFVNTFANNGPLTGLKEQIPNFGGVMGRSIINKANWLINYPERSLEVSNRDLTDDSFHDIPLDGSTSAPVTFIELNGKQYRAIMDLGSSSYFNVPEDSPLAAELLNTLEFRDSTRQRYTVGGTQTITERVGIVPAVTIGGIRFEDVKTTINVSSQIRVGMPFFEDCLIYIDNDQKRYRIKKIN